MKEPKPSLTRVVDQQVGVRQGKGSFDRVFPYRAVAENLPIGIVFADSDGLTAYLNPKFTEIFGYTLEDIPNRRMFLEKACPNRAYRAKIMSAWMEDSRDPRADRPKETQFQAACKDGSVKMVKFVHYRFEAGGSLFTCEDITRLVHTQKALARSEKRYRLVFEKSVDPMIVFNEHGALDCNEAMLRMFFLSSKKELEALDFLDLLPDFQPDGRSATQLAHDIVQKTLSEGNGRVECVVRPARGEEKWVDMSLSRIALPDGKTAVYSVWRDVTERKRVEEQVEYLSSLPRVNPNPVLELDWDGNVRFSNVAAVEMLHDLGVAEDVRLFLPADIKDILSSLRYSGKSQYYCEIALDGAFLGISIHYVKRVDGIHVYVKNITERKRTEDALRQSEGRAKRIFNNIPLPTFVVGFDGGSIVDVNRAAVNHYGYTREEFLHMNISDLTSVGNDFVSGAHPNENETRESEKGLRKHKKKDDTFIDVEVISEPLHAPGKEYTIVIVNDITEKRKAEGALKFTQFAVDHAAVGVIWIEKDGRILYVNDEICRSLGYVREELLTMMAHDISPSYPAHSWEIIWKNVKRLGSATVQTIYKSKTEKIFPVELTANYMDYDGNGYVCAIVRDITESKRAEEALSKREGELKVESSRLAEANTALKVLLKHREEDRLELENKFLSNIKQLIFPYLDRLKTSHLDVTQLSCLEIIETNLNDIVSPFLQKMSVHFSSFTPTEIQVADLIKIGKTTKEIAAFMKVSTGTVDTHRNSIRTKLGLNNKKMNLRTFLLSLV